MPDRLFKFIIPLIIFIFIFRILKLLIGLRLNCTDPSYLIDVHRLMLVVSCDSCMKMKKDSNHPEPRGKNSNNPEQYPKEFINVIHPERHFRRLQRQNNPDASWQGAGPAPSPLRSPYSKHMTAWGMTSGCQRDARDNETSKPQKGA